MTARTRVALLGGSFNPPHVAHQLVALYVLETQPVDELWLVPTYVHVFGKALAPYEARVAMCARAAAALGPRARVDRSEEVLAARPDFTGSRTLDLLEHLAATRPDVAPRLVVGTDILGERASWYRWDAVVAAAPLIVVGRPGHPLPPGSAATGLTMPDVSSTQVRAALAALAPADRAALAAGEVPAGAARLASLLPAAVLRYIAERALYVPDEGAV